ncbi:ferredoxin [Patescibacteria group bacterium]|nr:ferredoxin [Patescibacteria group bacterium]
MQDIQNTSKLTVHVDPEKCTGCGTCTALADQTFALNDENISEVINQNGNSDEDKLLAAQSCPTQAITVTEEESEEKV